MTSFYLITDTHYFSRKNWTEGRPVIMRVRDDQIALLETPEILDSYIDLILSDKQTDTVLFLGDNVDNSDMVSHGEFRQRLERLNSNGKKVYMIYATHDYIGGDDDENNFQTSKRFTADSTEPIAYMRRAELPEFYYDYTAKNALDIHKGSGSYTVRLDESTLLIAIIDNGNGRSYCGLFDDGFEWLEKQIDNAEKNGQSVILAVHHPVLPPWDLYKNSVPEAMFGGSERLIELMCRKNVRVVFTGHTHVQNIRKHTGEKGNWFYDISTISLANAFGKIRKVTVSDEGVCNVESIMLKNADGKGKFEYLYTQNAPGIWEVLLPLGAKNFNEFLSKAEGYLPVGKLKKMKIPVVLLCKRINKMNLLSVSKIAFTKKNLTIEEREKAKGIQFDEVVFGILRSVFAGNGRYTPDTVEYKVISGLFEKADRVIDKLRLEKIKSKIPDISLKKIGDDFLYNSRTGDDDSITFSLK